MKRLFAGMGLSLCLALTGTAMAKSPGSHNHHGKSGHQGPGAQSTGNEQPEPQTEPEEQTGTLAPDAAAETYACNSVPNNFDYRNLTDNFDEVQLAQPKIFNLCSGQYCSPWTTPLLCSLEAQGDITYADMFKKDAAGNLKTTGYIFSTWINNINRYQGGLDCSGIKDALNQAPAALTTSQEPFRDFVKRRLNNELDDTTDDYITALLYAGFRFPLFDCSVDKYGDLQSRLLFLSDFLKPYKGYNRGAFGNTPLKYLYNIGSDTIYISAAQSIVYLTPAQERGIVPKVEYTREAPACCCIYSGHTLQYNKCTPATTGTCNPCPDGNCCPMRTNCPAGHPPH